MTYGVVSLPFEFVSGWVVERRFKVAARSAAGWFFDRAKALLVGVPLALPLVFVFSWALQNAGIWWWAPVAAAVTIFSIVLNRVGPALLFRLFYRLTPLAEGTLRERITELCGRTGFEADGVFSFNMSKTTKKANAALAGIGRARRVLLADTLLGAFSEDEIVTVVAHELAHHRFRHVPLGMLIGAAATTAALCATALLHSATLSLAGVTSIHDLAALPLVPFWLTAVSTLAGPAGNALSRRRERQADSFAVQLTGDREAFVSALRKLATMNLADPDPHPLVEFLFHSHPSIGRRIAIAQSG
jgi:STE24 endopeptidase